MGGGAADSTSRRKLLDELARFAAVKRVRVAVVFDGAPEDFFPDGASYRGVKIFYAVRGSDADERIKWMVERQRERRTLRVITSDTALARYVRLCGAPVFSVKEFRRQMQDVMANDTESSDRAAPQVTGELNEWMRYFGVEPEDDERR